MAATTAAGGVLPSGCISRAGGMVMTTAALGQRGRREENTSLNALTDSSQLNSFFSGRRSFFCPAVIALACLCTVCVPWSWGSRSAEVAPWSPRLAAAAETPAEDEEESKEATEESEKQPKLTGAKLAELMQMDLKEIQDRMALLFDMVDTNKDEKIDATEAKEWSTKLKNAMHQRQVQMEFQAIDKNNDGTVSFQELAATYVSGSDEKQLAEHKEEVRKRFKAVDKNGDEVLNFEEVMLLMDPGKDENLMQLEIDEILMTQDKNKDGKITLQEFIETEGGSVSEAEKKELQKEFSAYDVDKDGSIDAGELRRIIQDPHAHEIETLLEEFSKEFVDGVLPRSRWMQDYEKFAVSMLTDNGEALRYPEDYKGIKFPFSAAPPKPSAAEEKKEEEHDEL